ncbi:MAG: Arginine biosynthesis bifunctional protein ArgJ [bacterium]|nr:Arginine biosynthesis bifunctional protein ArgJ [bacterium]
MKDSPLISVLQCLRFSEAERQRLLAETEVPSQVVAAFFRVAPGDDSRAVASVLLDEISEFGELVRVTPDPGKPALESEAARDYLIVAIIPITAAEAFEDLLRRPSIERRATSSWEDRGDLKQLFDAGVTPQPLPEEEDPEDLLDRARKFILSNGGSTYLNSHSEPLPHAAEERLAILTLPKGFRASGVRCGIKGRKYDLGILFCEGLPAVSGRFTRNRFASGPVQLCRRNLERHSIRALVVNSGNSNAATGERGHRDAERMAELVAECLGLEAHQVLVCSTGVIGRFLPMEKIEPGIREAAEELEVGRDERFIQAMMTTDTRMKHSVRAFQLGGREVTLAGATKGAGMIQPNLATMFAFITTDAAIRQSALDQALGIAVHQTFNRLTVDADTSTSDSVIAFAGGAAGNDPVGADHPEFFRFVDELRELCLDLTRRLARDGEGATHLVRVAVEGAFNALEAERVAKSIANSMLVKTAVFGRDPNWGRILMAIGNSDARFDPNRVRVWLAGMLLFENGMGTGQEPAEVSQAMGHEEVEIRVDLGAGEARATVYTCDLSYEYVRINAEYTT